RVITCSAADNRTMRAPRGIGRPLSSWPSHGVRTHGGSPRPSRPYSPVARTTGQSPVGNETAAEVAAQVVDGPFDRRRLVELEPEARGAPPRLRTRDRVREVLCGAASPAGVPGW